MGDTTHPRYMSDSTFALSIKLESGDARLLPGSTVSGWVSTSRDVESKHARLAVRLHGRAECHYLPKTNELLDSRTAEVVLIDEERVFFNGPIQVTTTSFESNHPSLWPFSFIISYSVPLRANSGDNSAHVRPISNMEEPELPLSPTWSLDDDVPNSARKSGVLRSVVSYQLLGKLVWVPDGADRKKISYTASLPFRVVEHPHTNTTPSIDDNKMNFTTTRPTPMFVQSSKLETTETRGGDIAHKLLHALGRQSSRISSKFKFLPLFNPATSNPFRSGCEPRQTQTPTRHHPPSSAPLRRSRWCPYTSTCSNQSLRRQRWARHVEARNSWHAGNSSGTSVRADSTLG
ncbi:hypothetical protein M427DRAFT_359598 [Gonapodya prolifera JEL478]|uniref:Uncharacterized protein n=1 Tax=Gonapodya prolifera (strain JEL478) TaxID=1344416 RepID=A0A139ABV7_GONPJ|nr:hypothetical protein M427DRAFT_359598 [Gonapodya prolifera JEL478]|eukprot:KXS13903.1 hypothetical protein M427DRAFT_359598 [Gonapodya prolifera JEL478]